MRHTPYIRSILATLIAGILCWATPSRAQVTVTVQYLGNSTDNTIFFIQNYSPVPIVGATISGRGYWGNRATGTIVLPVIPPGGEYIFPFNSSSTAFTNDFDDTFNGHVIYTLSGNIAGSPFVIPFSPNQNLTGAFVPFLGNSFGGFELDSDVPNTLIAPDLRTGNLVIALKSKSQFGMLAYNGMAFLGGGVTFKSVDGFVPRAGEKFTFLSTTSGVYGTFSSVTNETGTTGTILGLELIYDLKSVTMEITQGSFDKFAETFDLTPNQKAVAVALDHAVGNSNNRNLIQFLDGEPLGNLPRDFDRIAPEELTSIFTLATAIATEQSINIQRRTEDIRSGSSGFSAARFAMNGIAPSYSGAFDISSGVAGPSGNDGKESKEMKTVAPAENRWGAFLSGTGEWVNVSGTDNARGYDLTNGGFTLGVDYKVCPNFAIGLMAGYTGSTADLTDHGRVWVNGGNLGLYATTFAGGWYADAAATGGYNGYDTRRSGLEGDARGSTDGGVLNVLFGTGYDFQTKSGFTFGPTASFNYTYTGLSNFTEHGSLAPLNIDGGRGESLRTAFGLKASYDCKVGNIHIRPEVRAAWQHEYGDSVYSLNSSFSQGADNFSVTGPKFGRDSLLLGAGFAIQCTERISTYFYYDGELGRTNYESNAVTGGIRVAF